MVMLLLLSFDASCFLVSLTRSHLSERGPKTPTIAIRQYFKDHCNAAQLRPSAP